MTEVDPTFDTECAGCGKALPTGAARLSNTGSDVWYCPGCFTVAPQRAAPRAQAAATEVDTTELRDRDVIEGVVVRHTNVTPGFRVSLEATVDAIWRVIAQRESAARAELATLRAQREAGLALHTKRTDREDVDGEGTMVSFDYCEQCSNGWGPVYSVKWPCANARALGVQGDPEVNVE